MGHALYIALPMGASALLLAASGVATLGRAGRCPGSIGASSARGCSAGTSWSRPPLSAFNSSASRPSTPPTVRPSPCRAPQSSYLLVSLTLIVRAQRPSPTRHAG